jgi:hypothetical protein
MVLFLVKDVASVMGRTIVDGYVEDGILKARMKTKLDERLLEIVSMEVKGHEAKEAIKGQMATIVLKMTTGNFGEGITEGNTKIEFDLVSRFNKRKIEFE